MTRGRLLAVALGGVLVVAVVGAGVYLAPIGPIATGYAAKISCSGHFVGGRPFEQAILDLPDNPLRPFLRADVDEAAGTVSTSLVGLYRSTAWYTPGAGCTLADERPELTVTPVQPHRADAGAEWPRGDAVDTAAAVAAQGLDADALTRAVDGAFAEDDPAGRKNTRAVVVVHDGRIVAERYADGFDAETRLLGWSMGKSVANAIVGRLVDQGVLAVADDDLLPRWSGDARADITVDDLLHMTSGLAFAEVYEPDTDATRMLFTPGDTAAYAAAKELVAAPGTRWSYSSGTTNILCDVAHDASGLGVAMARELVFAPLGMDSAIIEPDASGGLVCSSFPYATARDWARFGQWYLQDGRWEGEQLLPEGWVAYSTRPVEVGSEQPYGAHWWLNEGAGGQQRMPDVPADAFWASGNEGQQTVVIPSADLVVVRLGFTSDFAGIAWGLEPLVAGVVDATR